MSAIYHEGNRDLQERFDTTRIADRIEEVLLSDTISDHDKAFIESRDMFFLATADDAGLPSCSYKGGEPAFVRVIDEHTVAFPNFDGNGMYLSMGNVLVNSAVGMLFIDFERGHRMRLNGTATIDANDPLMSDCPGAQFIIQRYCGVREAHTPAAGEGEAEPYKLVERSRFVPKKGKATPVPAWKCADWPADALPANDLARDPTREVI